VNKPKDYLKTFEPTEEELEMARADGIGETEGAEDCETDLEVEPTCEPTETEEDMSVDASDPSCETESTGDASTVDETGMEDSEICDTVTPGQRYTIAPGETIWEIAVDLKAQGVKGTTAEIAGKILELNHAQFTEMDPMAGDEIRLPVAEGQIAACNGEEDTGYTGPTDCNWDQAMEEVQPGCMYTIPEDQSLYELAQELHSKGVCSGENPQLDLIVIMDLLVDLNPGVDLMGGTTITLPTAEQTKEVIQEQLKADVRVNRPIPC
jgi:hypothetical protein